MRERENWAVLHINSARRKQISINSEPPICMTWQWPQERFFMVPIKSPFWCWASTHFSSAPATWSSEINFFPFQISGVDLCLAWRKSIGDGTGWRKCVVSIFPTDFWISSHAVVEWTSFHAFADSSSFMDTFFDAHNTSFFSNQQKILFFEF